MTPTRKTIFNAMEVAENKKKKDLDLLNSTNWSDNELKKALERKIYNEYFEQYQKIIKNYE